MSRGRQGLAVEYHHLRVHRRLQYRPGNGFPNCNEISKCDRRHLTSMSRVRRTYYALVPSSLGSRGAGRSPLELGGDEGSDEAIADIRRAGSTTDGPAVHRGSCDEGLAVQR
jgi:hypothetical protein